MKLTRGLMAIIVAAALVLGTAAAATAWRLLREDDQVTRGVCNNRAYELTVEPEDGGLEVSFELQSMAPNEIWTVRIEQNGTALLEGDWITDEDAEIDLDAHSQTEGGGDEFTVDATDTSGDNCTASLQR